MRRLLPLLVLALAAAPAAAGKRAKIVTPEVAGKLSPTAVRNMNAVVSLVGKGADGTGLVLHRARGLVVINAHMTDEELQTVHTASGGSAPVREILLTVPEKDLAFVRVGRLPKGTTQVTLDTTKAPKGTKVYGLSAGFGWLKTDRVRAGQHESDPEAFVRAHRKIVAPGARDGAPLIDFARQLVANHGSNLTVRLLGRGRVNARITGVAEVAGEKVELPVLETNLPHAPGASGGGVFARDTDALVAVHSGGIDGTSMEIAAKHVVAAARDGLASGRAKGSARGIAALRAWLGSVSQ